jgi:hypothetical protein
LEHPKLGADQAVASALSQAELAEHQRRLSVKALPYRVMRNQPGRLEDCLRKDGIVLITRKGEPFAFMLGLADESLVDTFGLITQLRAQRAVASMRGEARGRGLDCMVDRDVQAEIDAARRSVQRRPPRS